ncbi:Protein kinase-like domain [Apiospora arundinis]
MSELRELINNEAVCALARKLKGVRCRIEHSTEIGTRAKMGSANYHARVCFDDGTAWLLRVPRVTRGSIGLSQTLAAYLVESEYATLAFLKTQTSVPVPTVFEYGTVGARHAEVGVSFLLMEELPGKPYAYKGTAEEKAKLWKGVANILAELARHPFSKASSLIHHESQFVLSRIASDRFVVLDPSGPFDTAEAYYRAFSVQHLDLITSGQIYVQYPVNAYLIYRFMKENVKQLADDQSRDFFLKHVDDKGDHLLIDDDYNIIGVIDWQMARTVPAREAFGPSLVSADMESLCGGHVSLSDADQELIINLDKHGIDCRNLRDEKSRRFFWGLALEPEWECALPLAQAILETFGVEEDWEVWKARMLDNYQQDAALKHLLEREGPSGTI